MLLVNFCVCTKMNVFALVLTCLRVTLTRVITRVRLSLYIPNIFSYSLKRGCNKFTAPFIVLISVIYLSTQRHGLKGRSHALNQASQKVLPIYIPLLF